MKAWMALTGEDSLQLIRIRDDCFGYADMNDGFLRLIVIDGNFESDFFRLADAFLEGGGVLLDVGANYGLLSCGLAGRHSENVEFHLFEPNAGLIPSIRRSVALYPSMRCQINCSAVSDRVGTVVFAIDETQSGASHISEGSGAAVQSTTIDHYLDEEGIDTVALLKVDVEGYELAALRGARRSLERKRIRAIYFEYFEKLLVRVAPPAELLALFDAVGYEVCFCRAANLERHGRDLRTIRKGLAGHGLPLQPVKAFAIPAMTDLLAVPKEDLVPAS